MPDPGSLAAILKIGSDITGLAFGLNQAMELFGRLGSIVEGVMSAIVQTVQKGVQAMMKLGQAIMQLTQHSARLDSMRDSFNKMAAEFGATGQQLLTAMREATIGMAQDSDLIQSAMTGMMLVSQEAMGDVTKTIPMFAKIATSAARALGEDVGFMFDSLTRGIGRASPMILDNLGFTISLTQVYGDYARQLGKTRKELSLVEKQTALVNEVMRQGQGYVDKLGISTGGLATSQKQLATEIANLKDVIGQAFMPIVQRMQQMFTEVAAAVIDKLIPAFRNLGRVFSEVFGTKNPFMRWTEGDPVQATTERIQGLYAELMRIQGLGPDFIGEVTAAMEDFNKELDKLEEKFGPRFAKIIADLTERVRDIWDSFRKAQRRRDQDFHKETERRTEDHYERLEDIRNRYDLDIADAIRKRDARALLNLMRQQAKEQKSEKDRFSKEEKRREQDHEQQKGRAREDAEERAADARKSAAKQTAAVQAEYDKALAKLETARDKEIAKAAMAWEAELENLRKRIDKQMELREQQAKEVAEMEAELAKPLPPFFENLKTVLTVINEKLQAAKVIIMSLITGEMAGEDVLERIGLDPEKLQGIMDFFNEFRRVLGPEFALIWEDLKEAFVELKPVLPLIIELLKELAPIVGVILVAALMALIVVLRTVTSVLPPLIRYLVDLGTSGVRIFTSAVEILKNFVMTLLALIQGDFPKALKHWSAFGDSVKEMFGNMFDFVIKLFVGSFETLEGLVLGFVEAVLGMFGRLSKDLVDESIIPDMMRAIQDVVRKFMDSIIQMWRQKWDNILNTFRNIWQRIINSLSQFLGSGFQLVQRWVGNISRLISTLIAPFQRVFGMLNRSPVGAGAGGQTVNINANNWGWYGEQANTGNGTVDDITNAIREVTGRFSDQWRVA